MVKMEGENTILKRFNLKLVKLGLSVGETQTDRTDSSSILNNQDYGKSPKSSFSLPENPPESLNCKFFNLLKTTYVYWETIMGDSNLYIFEAVCLERLLSFTQSNNYLKTSGQKTMTFTNFGEAK